MNHIAEEIESYFGCGSETDKEVLEHYGMPRRSGRYPWGSGDEPYQHSRDFLGRVEEMRKSGFTYTDPKTGNKYTGDNAIAKSFGYSSTDFRTVYAIAKDARRTDDVATAKRLKEKEGMNVSEIGRKMGINESSVRSLLNSDRESRMKQARDTADFLKERVDSSRHGMIDVGNGVEKELRISKEKLDQALFMLQAEGHYEVYSGRFDQVTNKGQMTTQKVLCKPGTEHKDIYQLDKIDTVKDYISRDDGKTFEKKFHYPESMDSKRLKIRYAEDGGVERDGLVQLRPGVPDLSLGESRYSQVRIMVDNKKYIKGMAVYGDPKDFPPGVDVIFNTNKHKDKSKLEVLKDIKSDPDNPFGSLIKDADQGGQYWYTDKSGKKKLGLINKRSDEGDWTEFTTMVQFLNTFYGKGTRDMRRMHHLLNAVIIFDEIQTVPVKCMALFNGAINFLNRMGNTSTILCTATQPDFSNISKDISLENVKGELIHAVEGNFTQLKRVEIKNCCAMKPYTIENAATFIWEKKAQVNSLLVVVNKIKTAKDLFRYLQKDKENVETQNIENVKGVLVQDTRLFLLTGDQCPEHKKDVLDELLKALKKGEQVICISTSLIEAGVDISFQAAIRNMTKLDSIVQTAGRVNRNGERNMGYCYVINLEEGSYEHMSEIRLGQKWSNVIFYKAEQEKKDILLPELMKEYFDDYYNDNECSGNFKYPIDGGRRSIYELLTLKRNQTGPKLNWKIQFKRAAENFKVIDEDMTTVLVPYLEEGQGLMRQIEDVTVYTSMAERKELLEKAKKYSLNINRYKFRQIYDAGGITFKEDMGVYLLNYAFYDEKEMGILLEADSDKYIM